MVYTFTNGSFETGNFRGWTLRDLSSPYRALTVDGAGISDNAFSSFVSAPTDGSFAALTGFDGNGPGRISLGQFVTLHAPSTLHFDWRAGWDLVPYGATQDREFIVQIENAGGNVLSSTTFLTAQAGTNVNDTGNNTDTVSLAAFAGQTVFIRFLWRIPESFTGPGFFQLDNVSITTP